MKKIILALLLLPQLTFAVTSVPWLQTNLTDTYITPARVNGINLGLLTNASSTLQRFTFTNATGTSATTTNFFSTNLFGTSANITDLLFTRATGTSATTTNFFSTTASSTNLFSSLLSVGGTQGLNVIAGGNVGVGTLLPTQKFQVNDTATAAFVVTSAGQVGIGTKAPTHALTFPVSSTGITIYNTADQTTNKETGTLNWVSNAFQLFTRGDGSGTVRPLILGAGSGTGQTSPNHRLTINAGSPMAKFQVAGTDTLATMVEIGMAFGGLGSSAGSQTMLLLDAAIAQSGTAGYTALLINPTETTVGSGTKRLISAQVDSVDKFVVDNTGIGYFAGNVGIGTTGPGVKLDVRGAIVADTANNGYGGVRISDDSTGNYHVYIDSGRNAGSDGTMQFRMGARADAGGDWGSRTPDTIMTLKGTGNVGIGTTGPAYKLDVAATSATGIIGRFLNLTAPTTSGQQGLLEVGFSTGRSLILGSAADAGTGTPYNGFNYINSQVKPLTIIDDSGTNVMTLSNGNVGIGTTGPSQKLQVVGGTFGVYDSASTAGVTLSGNSGLAGFSSVYSDYLGGSELGLHLSNYGKRGDGTGGINIATTGNVGISTTTPAQKLTVAGDIGFYGTIPTLSSCGTSPAITKGSTDTAGEVTEGTISTGCVISFSATKANAPFCTVTGKAGLVFTYAVSTTAITITNVGALSSTNLVYQCVQNNN